MDAAAIIEQLHDFHGGRRYEHVRKAAKTQGDELSDGKEDAPKEGEEAA